MRGLKMRYFFKNFFSTDYSEIFYLLILQQIAFSGDFQFSSRISKQSMYFAIQSSSKKIFHYEFF